MGADHPLYGQLAAMGQLAARLDDLASVPSRASAAIAADLTDKLAEQFDAGKDAYGKPWRPLQSRTLLKHGPPPLTATGDMAAGTVARPRQGSGVTLDSPFPAGIHQTGAGSPDESDPHAQWGMHARPIFPNGPMPEAWRKVIDQRVAEAFGRSARGRR